MTVHFIWRASSSMPDRQDAFWVACSAAEVDAIILPVLSEDERTSFEHQRESLCSDGFVRANPSLAEADRWYFLIARDGSTIQQHPAWFPYGGQWNAWNPFERISVQEISELNELHAIALSPTVVDDTGDSRYASSTEEV